MQHVDVEQLVESKLLPPEVIPLKKELGDELHELEEQRHKGGSQCVSLVWTEQNPVKQRHTN